jgi:hypothetical protein
MTILGITGDKKGWIELCSLYPGLQSKRLSFFVQLIHILGRNREEGNRRVWFS